MIGSITLHGCMIGFNDACVLKSWRLSANIPMFSQNRMPIFFRKQPYPKMALYKNIELILVMIHQLDGCKQFCDVMYLSRQVFILTIQRRAILSAQLLTAFSLFCPSTNKLHLFRYATVDNFIAGTWGLIKLLL